MRRLFREVNATYIVTMMQNLSCSVPQPRSALHKSRRVSRLWHCNYYTCPVRLSNKQISMQIYQLCVHSISKIFANVSFFSVSSAAIVNTKHAKRGATVRITPMQIQIVIALFSVHWCLCLSDPDASFICRVLLFGSLSMNFVHSQSMV